MEIKIVKETRVSGKEWYCIYLDDKYHTSLHSAAEALDEVEKIKKGQAIEKAEVIHTETI